MAFLPFTKVKFKLENPSSFHVYMNKYGLVRIGSDIFSRSELQDFLDKLTITNQTSIKFAYDKQMSFGKYIETKLFVQKLSVKKGKTINYNLDYIY
jgi:biopolymer transport protein ExbD